MARASFATQTKRVNMAIRMLQQQRSQEAILSLLVTRGGISRRQAYLLCVRSPEQPPAAPSAGAQGGLYGQSAPSIDSGGAEPLSPTAPTDQSGRGRVVATLGGTKPLGWPRTRPEGTCDAFYNTVRIAMLQPGWLKFTSYWRLQQPPRLRN